MALFADIFEIGIPDLLVIFALVFLLFGASKLPEFTRYVRPIFRRLKKFTTASSKAEDSRPGTM